MNATVTILCYQSKTLANGENPLMIRVCKDGKKKYKSLGICVNPEFWDFEKERPKANCPNRELILKIILQKEIEYQKQILELKADEKEFTASTLIAPKVKRKIKAVREFYEEIIRELESANKIGNSRIYKDSFNSLNKFTGNKLVVPFSHLNTDFLKQYEKWMRESQLTDTTISLYFRILRSVYNKAIDAKHVKKTDYPFNEFKVSKFDISTENVKLAQYTFFTSRFFSAVDIDLQTTPAIVIISDLFYATHSMIDPHTEAIQIIGRFRKGTSAIIHVSNFNPDINYKTPEQLQNYLNGCHDVYIQLKRLFQTATGEGVRETLKEALERITYAKYIDEDDNKKHFAIDNYFDEEKVKSYYIHPFNLKQAYIDTGYFTVKHQHRELPLGDEDRLRISRADNKKEKRLTIIEQLDLLNGESGIYDEPLFREFRDSLHAEDTLIVDV